MTELYDQTELHNNAKSLFIRLYVIYYYTLTRIFNKTDRIEKIFLSYKYCMVALVVWGTLLNCYSGWGRRDWIMSPVVSVVNDAISCLLHSSPVAQDCSRT